jgi:hypothetical protein
MVVGNERWVDWAVPGPFQGLSEGIGVGEVGLWRCCVCDYVFEKRDMRNPFEERRGEMHFELSKCWEVIHLNHLVVISSQP